VAGSNWLTLDALDWLLLPEGLAFGIGLLAGLTWPDVTHGGRVLCTPAGPPTRASSELGGDACREAPLVLDVTGPTT